MSQNGLIERFQKKSATIGIIGMGYVGIPLSLRYSEVGFKVLGFDIDSTKVTQLNEGKSYIEHIPSQLIRKAKESGFRATTDFSEAKNVDALIICVPTPLNQFREPDLSYIISATQAIVPHLRKGQIVSLESTTYPGTTDEELLPRIEGAGFKVGEDIFLVFSPEREDPGNAQFSTGNTPKLVGGHTRSCLEAGLALYRTVVQNVVPVSSTRVAEMAKLLENIHRSVNIGLVNEMKIVCDQMGIDVFEVIRAAATKPFGFTAYYPGPGLGGHCIPIDPFYLTWKAREYGIHTRFIELAGEINSNMPNWVVSKIADALNQRGKALHGSKVLLLGVAYKKNIDDVRESPALEVIRLLAKKGAKLSFSDPHISELDEHDFHGKPVSKEILSSWNSVNLTPESVGGYDAVALITNHDKFDFPMILKNAQLIVDTRGVYSNTEKNVVRA